MSSNQREMERREKRAQKERKQKTVLWIIIAIIVLVLIIMKVCEININSVKNHFTDEQGNFTLTQGVVEDNFPYSIDSSRNATVININNKLGVLTQNSFTVINTQDGTADYMLEHGYSNPILKTAGVYSLIFDQGARKYRLDTTGDLVYEEEMSNTILCADVSKKGTVAVATTSKSKLCDITVFSKSLKKEMEISISDGYVVALSMNDNGKYVAACVVNGKDALLKTTVLIFNVSASKLYRSVELPQGCAVDISYSGNNLIALGENYVGVITKSGEYKEVYKKDSISARCFCYTPAGDLVLVSNSYNNSTDNTVSYIKPSGRIKNEIKVDGNIKSVSATSGVVSVLTNNEIISFNLSNGEEKGRDTTDDSANSICRLGSGIFIQKQSSIIKGGEQK